MFPINVAALIQIAVRPVHRHIHTGPGRRTILNDKQRRPLTPGEHLLRTPGGAPGSRECLRRAGHAHLPQHGGAR